MLYSHSSKSLTLQSQLRDFMQDVVVPGEVRYHLYLEDPALRWSIPPIMEEMKAQAKAAGLWNLFLPDTHSANGETVCLGAGLSNLDYAPLAEIMGRSLIAPEVFNCNAPDTGNMEVLLHYGNTAQQERWLKPLLNGDIRSAFAMTEPDVASSDATNIATRIDDDGDCYVVHGRKWWTTGASDPRCAFFIVMGVSNTGGAAHARHSMIIVPRALHGVEVVRPLPVFGYDDAPHGHAEVRFNHVRVPKENLVLGEGRGFEIAQGRLGPGRIHHCMRLIGLAHRALESMCERARTRVAFGVPLSHHGMAQEAIALSRCEIEQARLLTLSAAHALDTHGIKGAKDAIGMIKIVAPRMACQVIDRAIQIHGGHGLSDDGFLAHAYAGARALRIADGPDEVHIAALAKSMTRPSKT